MEINQNNPDLPLLQGIADDYRKAAEKTLKKGLKEIDKVFNEWEKDLNSLLEGAYHPEQENQLTPLDLERLEQLEKHVADFEPFDLVAYIEKALGDPAFNIGLVPKSGEPNISRGLDRKFWKKARGDSWKRRWQKRRISIRFRLSSMFQPASKRKAAPWGKQEYKPRLLAACYLAGPVTQLIVELLERRLREHARYFNQNHYLKEKEFRSVIKAASVKFSHSDGNLAEITDSHLEKASLPELSPLSSYMGELDETLTANLAIFLEISVIAGSKLIPGETFDRAESDRMQEAVRKTCSRYDRGWKAYFTAEVNDWVKDLQIISLQFKTIEVTNNTRRQLRNKLDENVLPKLDNLLAVVKASFDRIKESENSPQLREKILKESRLAVREIRLKNIPALVDAYGTASFIKALDNYSSRINYRFEELRDEFAIIHRLDIESIPPEVGTRTINLRKIIETEYLAPLNERAEMFSDEAEAFLANILRTLNEAGHMIQINLETAMEMLDDSTVKTAKKEDSGKIVSDGLDRIYRIIDKLRPESESIPASWGREIEKISATYLRGIDELLDNENIMNLIIRKTKADALRKIRELRHTFGGHARAFLRRSWGVISFGLTGARSGYEQISKMTGKSGLSESEKELLNFLYTTRRRIARLPFIYQRLYRYEALRDASLFVARTDEMLRLENCFQLWKTGNFASVAIVGDNGSGRTSFINVAQNSILKQVKLNRIAMPKGIRNEDQLVALFAHVIPGMQPASLDELEKALNDLQNPVAIVVEDMHNLFIRTIDGIDIIERFILLLSRTPEKVFWVVSIGKILWNFFKPVISIQRYFHEVIMLDDLSAGDMQEIIIKRHRLSGYELEFLAGDLAQRDRKYRKLATEKQKQEYLQSIFFKDLNEIAHGNISSALLIWQLSVDSIKPNKVIISNDLSFDPAFLELLSEDELFTLGAIAELESLTISEHAEIFHQNAALSELSLLGLHNKGLLYRSNSGFQIHFLMYKHILRILGNRNILK